MIFWLASYPKSGNTWIRSFISTYYLTNSDTFEFSYLKNIMQFPHERFFDKEIKDINLAINSWDEAQKKINSQNKIIFLKTHSALATINKCSFTSKEHSIAGIYIVRDPRNIITSLSNHYQLDFNRSLDFMTNTKKYLISINSISLDKLKKQEEKNGFPEAINNENKKINFFYLGKKNKWNKILKNNQVNLLNKKFDTDLKKLHYEI